MDELSKKPNIVSHIGLWRQIEHTLYARYISLILIRNNFFPRHDKETWFSQLSCACIFLSKSYKKIVLLCEDGWVSKQKPWHT